MTCEVWHDPEDNSTVCFEQSQKEINLTLMSKQAKFIRAISGDSWEEIMTKHHELMSWALYKT